MSSIRIARAAVRARPTAVRLPLQRRGYADAVSDKIKLTLALPHQVRFTNPFGSSSSTILAVLCLWPPSSKITRDNANL